MAAGMPIIDGYLSGIPWKLLTDLCQSGLPSKIALFSCSDVCVIEVETRIRFLGPLA